MVRIRTPKLSEAKPGLLFRFWATFIFALTKHRFWCEQIILKLSFLLPFMKSEIHHTLAKTGENEIFLTGIFRNIFIAESS